MLKKRFSLVVGVLGLFFFLGQASAAVYQYNMGPAANVAGYTDILETVYNVSDGYGWTYRVIDGSLDTYNLLYRTRGVNSDPLLDTVILENRAPFGGLAATDSRAFTLRFDVPNGVYDVEITSGDTVKSDCTFAVGDTIVTSAYGDFLKVDDSNNILFDSGVVPAGEHVTVSSGQFEVTNGYLYVGWGRRLGTIEFGTINTIVIHEILPPATCQEAIDAGYGLALDLFPDCVINFKDFAVMAEQWLRCIDPQIVGCEHPWE